MMQVLMRPWGAMHVDLRGKGPLVVFANSLGIDLRLWDAVLPLLPQRFRFARLDKPGHGLSDLADPVTIASLARDAAALIGDAGGRAIVVGLSIGGQIAQQLAFARSGLVRAMVLSNTASRLGTEESWQARIGAMTTGGIAPIADAVLDRWFAPPFRQSLHCAPWRAMLTRTTAALIPGAAFHIPPGAGHLPPVETPAAFAALLSPFLTGNAP
jgi:3-oxoadipate enol-lactonase